ncbi:MAG TPA: carbon-nitrogen hydrolase family protein [Thermoplasmata archaeon]|nr:carbon-nitrogen hydrolase family protein [Thermoplasmata archaeon]
MRILLAELASAPADVDRNLERLDRIASSARADLAVFPELFLTGYQIGDRWHELAVEAGGPVERRLGEIAHRTGGALVVGSPRRHDRRSGEIENVALLATPDGAVVAQPKRYLPTFGPFEEGSRFTPTSESLPYPVGAARVGLAICYDAFFPEVTRELALRGAELLVFLSAAPITSRALFDRLLPARAIENALPLVYVNRVGVEDGLVFGGGSVALDARGEPVALKPLPLDDATPGERLLEAEIDPKSAGRWRPFRPVLRDHARSLTAHGAREPRGR